MKRRTFLVLSVAFGAAIANMLRKPFSATIKSSPTHLAGPYILEVGPGVKAGDTLVISDSHGNACSVMAVEVSGTVAKVRPMPGAVVERFNGDISVYRVKSTFVEGTI